MTLDKCKKCGGRVVKKETLESGNTKFQYWRCISCGFENAEVVQEKKREFSLDI